MKSGHTTFSTANKSYFSNKLDEKIGDYTLSEAIRYFNEFKPNENITELLQAVTTFRAQTASEYRRSHEKLSDEKIQYYIDTLGESLGKYNDYLSNHKHTELSDALEFAKLAINDTLTQMGKEKKQDKIYVYYSKHDSSLKAMLSENQLTIKPGK